MPLIPLSLLLSRGGKFYRFTDEDETHHGVTYHTGLNIDPVPFNPSGSCQAGGMYFFHESQVKYMSQYCDGYSITWMREVTFPSDARIYAETHKYKCDKFILGERERIPVWVYIEAVKEDSNSFSYVPDYAKTSEMYLMMVKQHGFGLLYVPSSLRTYDVCLEAVKSQENALCLVPNEILTSELCLAAVKKNARQLMYVPDELKTEEMCLEAVRGNMWMYSYVPEELRTSFVKDAYTKVT